MPSSIGPQSDAKNLDARVHAAQVDEIYRAAPTGVIGALAGAAVLAGAISVIDRDFMARALCWATVLTVFGLCHLLLCRRYWRAPADQRDRPSWSRYICLAYLVEGLTWGWNGIGLVTPAHVNEQLLVYILIGTVASASVTALSSFLPAFHVFFLATISPIMIQGLLFDDPFRRAAGVFALVLTVTMLVLARQVNRSLTVQLRLRFQAEDLAAELRRQRELAEQASLSKSRFLASASHDLRQPVHALGMFVGALKSRTMDDEARRLVDYIEGSVSAMDDLFGALLDISRLDAGIVGVDPKSFPIERLLQRICRDHQAEAADKGVRLVLQPCSAIVRSDPILLERVLRNIVGNAVRYTDRGRIVVGCRRGAHLVVQVWDTGRGIPPDRQEAVFDEFYQLGNPERDRAKGLGLGLAIVKRLTTLLGHDVALCSKPARGSVFSVSVPFAGEAQVSTASEVAAVADAHRRSFIVVVDDEQLIREAMSSLLTSWGHTVIVAGSGAEMLEKLADCVSRPDLIICDYRLRDEETGVAVIQLLQSEYNDDIPGVLITGDTAPDRLSEARESGFLLLHKPVADAKLRAAIGNLLHAAATVMPETEDEAV